MRKFHFRSFISFSLLFSFSVMLISGLILYLAPPGRVARWSDWTVLGLTKSEWTSHHTISSFLFAIFAIIHLFFINRKAFFSYIKNRIKRNWNKKRELIFALIFFILFFMGTQINVFPFKQTMDFGAKLSDYWTEIGLHPPVPHAEEFTLEKLAHDLLTISSDSVVVILKQYGINANNNSTLEELAKKHDTSPLELFELLK